MRKHPSDSQTHLLSKALDILCFFLFFFSLVPSALSPLALEFFASLFVFLLFSFYDVGGGGAGVDTTILHLSSILY